MKTVISFTDRNYEHKWYVVDGDFIESDGVHDGCIDAPFVLDRESWLDYYDKEGDGYVEPETGESVKVPKFCEPINREEAEKHIREGARLIHQGDIEAFPNTIRPLTMEGEYFPGLHKLIPLIDTLNKTLDLVNDYDLSISIKPKGVVI